MAFTPEGQRAIDLANQVLARDNLRPNDEIVVLARNLLRAVEMIGLLRENNKAVAAEFERCLGGNILEDVPVRAAPT